MADSFRAEVRGKAELQRKFEQVVRDLRGDRFLQAMRDSTLLVQADAKRLAPVDTGRLRASITPEVRQGASRGDIVGAVGSIVEYAAAAELGSKPHFPPLEAVATWAERHGMSAFAVALAIARNGTKAFKFLQRAFEKNEETIKAKLDGAVSQIVAQ